MLVDLEREEKDETSGEAVMPDNNYPYGLCITLEEAEMEKLGIVGLPEIEAEFHGMFVAEVTRRAESEGHRTLSLQITMMEVKYEPPHEGEESETPKDEKREMRTLLDL